MGDGIQPPGGEIAPVENGGAEIALRINRRFVHDTERQMRRDALEVDAGNGVGKVFFGDMRRGAQTLTIQPDAAAPHGGKHFLCDGQIRNAQHRTTALYQRHGNGELRQADEKIGAAVDGVHHPDAIRVALFPRRLLDFRGHFLADHGQVDQAGERRNQTFLRGDVGGGKGGTVRF